jgi:hypothetical protein
MCVPLVSLVLECSHIIHSLSFGKPYPGMVNPLDGVRMINPNKLPEEKPGMYQYFLKVLCAAVQNRIVL